MYDETVSKRCHALAREWSLHVQGLCVRTRGVELYKPLEAGDLLQMLGHTRGSAAQGQHRRELSVHYVLHTVPPPSALPSLRVR
jgi:hypothetical protein